MSDPVNVLDSFDARDWAKAFVLHCAADPAIATDEDTMLSWFSSALMRGFDEAQTNRNPERTSRRRHHRVDYNARKFWESCALIGLQSGNALSASNADDLLLQWRALGERIGGRMNATILTSATGRYVTHCKLCRKAVAESPALDIPIIGHPGKRVEELLKVLLKHLTKHHAAELMEGAALLNEFQAFRILSAFDYEDPTMTPRLENIRAAVFALVRKNGFTDASLQHIVAGFGLDPEDAAKVNEAMRTVRDACCEFGQWAPKIPAPNQPVTP